MGEIFKFWVNYAFNKNSTATLAANQNRPGGCSVSLGSSTRRDFLWRPLLLPVSWGRVTGSPWGG